MAYEAWTVEWNMPVIVQDPFRRIVNGSWGNAPGVLPYTNTGGSASEHYVDGSRGIMAVGTLDQTYAALLPVSVQDFDVYGTVETGVVPTGGQFEFAIRPRLVDSGNFVDLRMFPQTDNTVTYSLRQFVGGVETVGGTGTVDGVAATDLLAWHVQASGSTLRAKIWNAGGEEPSAWTDSMTTTMVAAGALQLATYMVPAVSNARPIVVAWDDLLLVTPERWVDVTSSVDTSRGGDSGSPFEITSGDTPEASADTGGFGLPLLNADQRFTPGNILSTYYPNIAPGSQIRIRETIGSTVFRRGFGYVQYPEIQAWTQSNEDSPRDQMITIPVVDRAAWIAQGRSFISTLAEHIIYHAGPSLVGYWPLNETEGPDVNPAVGGPWTLSQIRRFFGPGSGSDVDPASITYGGANVAPADDLSSVAFSPALANDATAEFDVWLYLLGNRPTPITLSAGQVVTVVCWTRWDRLIDAPGIGRVATIAALTGSSDPGDIYASIDLQGATLQAQGGNTSDWFGLVDGPEFVLDHPVPVAVRVGFDPNTVELWVRGETYTDTMTINTAAEATFDQVLVGRGYPGAVNHVQVYVGDPDDWTHDDFLAQYAMGVTGLERQSTGERIRTILTYAGVDPSELGRIDDGSSQMQVARMAGRGPMDLVAEATDTEQGEFYIDGGNQPVFDGRVRLYNI